MSEVDWVDVQPYTSELNPEAGVERNRVISSPWFTRETPSTESSKRSLQPMQQAAARVLKMVSTALRPEVIASNRVESKRYSRL